MKLRPVSLATLALVSGLAAGTALAAPPTRATGIVPAASDGRSTYIVQLVDEPTTTYNGSTAGYAATKVAAGARFHASAAPVQSYAQYLNGKQDAALALVGNPQVLYRYNTVVNGFAVRLTDDQARTLLASPLVKSVDTDQALHLDTITTPVFLGLTAPGGLWSQQVNGSPNKGEDIVVGIVDLGISPENPAFADHVDGNGAPTFTGGTLAYGPKPATYTGTCTDGEGFVAATSCNNKLVGAQYFYSGFQGYMTAHNTTADWTSFKSPRDDLSTAPSGHGGHGDHTSSTSAGNAGNPANVGGTVLGQASGMAPRARIASYKVCFTFVNAAATDGSGSQNTCMQSDSMAAIDQAVKDGVNVINFSISGATNTLNDVVEQAFLRASNAGVFVAAAAGNSGPADTVNHPSPWLTTVAASTHSRVFDGNLTLGTGAQYIGLSLNMTAVPQTALIRAEDAGLNGGNANLCFSSASAASAAGQVTLDPAKVTGKVVICTRGTNARVDKSLAVLNAGGVGMVFVDNGSGLVAEQHSVPTIMVTATDGAAIKTYAATPANSPTAALGTYYYGTQPAPIMASFSGRGPNLFDSNLLKPDMTAPGVGVIAAVSSSITQDQKAQLVAGTLTPPPAYASYDGTSMATPHVAGVAALLKQAHPTWSPAAIKSALMTTAYSTLDDGLTGMQNGLLPWSQGAGHINPDKATDPGLVYDAGSDDWTKYQCLLSKATVTDQTQCTTIGTLDFSYNLNYPSITVTGTPGIVSITRRVTNVGTSAATYTSSVTVPGFTATVTPSSLTLTPGQTQSFVLKLTPTTATANVYQYGSLTWSDGTHNVVSPVTISLGQPIAAPGNITATTASGSRLIGIQTGFTGKMTGAKGGLKAVTMSPAATLVPGAYTQAQFTAACQAGVDTTSMKVYSFAVPANAIVAKFALRQQDVSGANDDNDLMVLPADGSSPLISNGSTSNESVQLLMPSAGTYRVCVTAWGGATSMTHSLSSWVVAQGDAPSAGNFTVLLPGSVFNGGTGTVGFAWSGLPTGGRFLGGELFKDASGIARAATPLYVDTTGAIPAGNSERATSAPGKAVAVK